MNLLHGPLRWDLLLARACAHELYPLLYKSLHSLGFVGVPTWAVAELEALVRVNEFRNSFLVEELKAILEMMHQASLPIIPLKGLWLAHHLYGDKNLRVSADIDLLVPRGKVHQAVELLLSRGYQADVPSWFCEDFQMRDSFEYAMFKIEQGVTFLVEIHWDLSWGAVDRDRIWSEARPEQFLGFPICTMSPEWLLLFLAIHAARHGWEGLKWIADIHEICLQNNLDWEKIAECSSNCELSHLLEWSLGVCEALIDTPIPPQVRRRLPPAGSRLFPAMPSSAGPWQGLRRLLREFPRPTKKAKAFALWFLIPKPNDYLFCPLPRSLGFLYYLLRPVRLAMVATAAGWSFVWRVFRQPRPASPRQGLASY